LTGRRRRSEHGTVRLRSLLVAAAVVVAVLTVASAPAHAGAATPVQQPDAGADDDGASGDDLTENPEPGAPDQDIIPLPNSGREPTDAGDRGGPLQIGVFVAIVVGLGGIGALAVRDARRGRAGADRS
jgi:hypothetical protein